MKNLYPIIVLALYLATPGIAYSQEWNRDWSNRTSSGFRDSAKVNYVEPGTEVRKIEKNNIAIHPDVKKIIDNQIKKLPTKILLVAKGDEIFYEYHSSPRNSKKWTPLGMSMSKSLTAMTVGKAFCDGLIHDLDDKLSKYVYELEGTSWGNASIKNILSMSSGSYKTDIKFNGAKHETSAERILSRAGYDGKNGEDFISIMKSLDENNLIPGEAFYYNNMDTIALGLLVEAATKKKFYDYFEESIWKQSGAEHKGAWIANNLNQTSTYNGFSATPHDWLRLGLYVLDSRSKDDCFGKFLVEGTKKVLTTKMFVMGQNYGFQIWVNCRPKVDFCFLGHGRQYLWFNLEKNIVMYHHATTETMDEPALISAYLNIVDNINSH
jgi:CubicO group peptidase (beta-lactamase class C family)